MAQPQGSSTLPNLGPTLGFSGSVTQDKPFYLEEAFFLAKSQIVFFSPCGHGDVGELTSAGDSRWVVASAAAVTWER